MKHRKANIGVGIIVLFVFLMNFVFCKKDHDYHWVGQNREDIEALFQADPARFQKLAEIFIYNEKRFWPNECNEEGTNDAWISSPNDTEKMSYFSQNEQQFIRDFFEETHPYMIGVYRGGRFAIDYINEEETDGFTFSYFYNTEPIFSYEKDIVNLQNGWYVYE